MARTSQDHNRTSAFFANRKPAEAPQETPASILPEIGRSPIRQRVSAAVQAMSASKEQKRYDEEQRRGVRASIDLPAECSVGGVVLPAQIKDISSTGMQLLTAAPIPVGAAIVVHFDVAPMLADRRRKTKLSLNGRVVRSMRKQTAHENGIRFAATPEIAALLRDIVLAVKLDTGPKATVGFVPAGWSGFS